MAGPDSREGLLALALGRTSADPDRRNTVKLIHRSNWGDRQNICRCQAGVSDFRCRQWMFCTCCATYRSGLLQRQMQWMYQGSWRTWLVTLRPAKPLSTRDPAEFKAVTDKGIKLFRHLQKDGLIVGAVAVREIAIIDLANLLLLPHVHAVVLLPEGHTLLGADGRPKSRLRHWLPRGWDLDVRELANWSDSNRGMGYLIKPINLGRAYALGLERGDSPSVLNPRVSQALRWAAAACHKVIRVVRMGVCHGRSRLGQELRPTKAEIVRHLKAEWAAKAMVRRIVERRGMNPLLAGNLPRRPGRTYHLQDGMWLPRAEVEKCLRRALAASGRKLASNPMPTENRGRG